MVAELSASFTAVCIESSGPIVIELSILSDVAFSSAETAGIMITKSKNIRRIDIFLIFSPPFIIFKRV
ncbi:hypothetical protein BK798_02395 [Methanobrevibacter smithii]|uniref:Uncharacterized protein n=1 Tax=Methanobrevibacter smithii TaxID=2173 RepID=A0A2H4U5F0_METSM|nr:hypothetical protein [Methanobrevibacter smithii]ATZ59341.1 hypothetical protein BK798_02395 [Methanobrevibacter smithii]